MCDRQVSIRLGKGFWSRGPGPALHLRAADFPTLQEQALGPDNMGLLFQAHLELTQLISNAHDILYSSTSHRQQLYIGGEYVRYIVGAKPLYKPVDHLLTSVCRMILLPWYGNGSFHGQTIAVRSNISFRFVVPIF